MNKRIKMVLSAAALSLTLVATAVPASHADTVSELKQALISAGVPSSYVGNVVDYLQKVNITQAQANQIKGKINEAKSLIGDVKNLGKLDSSVKTKIQSLAIQAGNIVGLNVNFGKSASGATVVVVTTPSGGTLLQLSTVEAGGLVTDFNIDTIINAVEEAIEFSNDPNKNDLDGDGKPDNPNFKPEGGGDLNNTATPYGNLMLAGTTMMGMAGGVHVISKKRK